MSYKCEFCGNNFTFKKTLLNHQRSAKYCLEKRGIQKLSNVCENCGKNFSEKRYLLIHEEKCIKKSQDVISTLKSQLEEKNLIIIDLKARLECYERTIKDLHEQVKCFSQNMKDVAIQGVKKSTTTTNNTINLQPLTKEWMDKQALLLTEEHLLQGVSGLAQFAVDNSFKDRVVCTDITRKSLKYKENDGKVSKDPRGKKLSKMFFESIEAKAEDIIPTMIERIKEEMDDVCEESGGVFESVCIKMDEIIKVKKGIKHITKGQEHELKEEFTKQLCELLPNP